MAILSHQELFDFDGYFKRIADLLQGLEGVTTDWSQSTVSSVDRIKSSLDSLQKKVAPLRESLKGISITQEGSDQKVADYIQKIAQVGEQAKLARKSQTDLSDAQKLNAQVITDLTAKLTTLKQRHDSLDSSSKDYAKQQRAILSETKTVTRAIDAQSKSLQYSKQVIDAAEGSYVKLTQQTNELRGILRNMPGAFDQTTGAINKHNAAAREMQAIIERNDRVLKAADATMGQHQRKVGDYAGALRGIGSDALLAAGGLIGISSAMDAITSGLGIISNMERIDSSLKAVSKDTDDFRHTQEFLIGTADRLGLQYEVLARSYKGLKAATNGTALEGKATEKIFTGLVNSGAALKLSNEEVEGALQAVTQMMSKGHVQAEELRGQLGERLPGAIKLLAEGMGVSEIKLNKMMEQGQLLAVDVLPKLAAQLDKTYGKDAQSNVETMAGGWNRMTNEVHLFLAALNENKAISNTATNFQNMITETLKGMKVAIQSNDWKTFFGAFTNIGPIGTMARQQIANYAQNDTVLSEFKTMTPKQREARIGITEDNIARNENDLKHKYANTVAGGNKAAVENSLMRDRELLRQLKRENLKQQVQDRKDADQAEINAERAANTKKEADKDRLAKEAKARAAAQTKAENEAERRLNESLSKSKAGTDSKLADLSDDKQNGLIDEQTFIEKRQAITQAGLTERQKLLERAGKKETDDYINVLKDKQKAETEYSRTQLQLDLKNNKSDTDKKVSALDPSDFEGGTNDLSYIDQRHNLIKAGIEQEKAIIKEAGLEKSTLYQDAYQRELDENEGYFKKRLTAEKKAWKDSQDLTKEALKGIDQQTEQAYAEETEKIHRFHNNQRSEVELSLASGRISQNEANNRLYAIDVNELKDELTAYRDFVAKSKVLAKKLVDDRIEHLRDWAAYSGATEQEVAEVNKQIRDLEKTQQDLAAKDQMKLQKKVADNGKEQSDKERDHKKKNAEESRQQMMDALATVTSPVEGGFEIENLQGFAVASIAIYDRIHNHKKRLAELEAMSDEEQKIAKLEDLKDIAQAALVIGQSLVTTLFSIEQQKTANELTELDRRKEQELALAGDSADAKATIEKKYDAERKELQHKQDVQARDRAVFEIAIATAVAVVKSLPNIPLSIFVGALGALQIGLTLARPLPTYKTGKKATDAYEGKALAGEAGEELFIGADGSTQLLTKPTIIDTKAGDTIYTASETSTILNNWKKQQAAGLVNEEINLNNQATKSLQTGRQTEVSTLIHELFHADPARRPMTATQFREVFMDVWQNAPRHETIIDFDGMKKGLRQAQSHAEYMEKRNRW